ALSSSLSLEISLLFIRIFPASFIIFPAIIFNRVLLPHPFGPIIAVHLFSSIFKLKSLKRLISLSVPLLKVFDSLFISSMTIFSFLLTKETYSCVIISDDDDYYDCAYCL